MLIGNKYKHFVCNICTDSHSVLIYFTESRETSGTETSRNKTVRGNIDTLLLKGIKILALIEREKERKMEA